MKEGDIITITGVYARRTFWQWLTRQSRQLQQFRVRGAGQWPEELR